MQTLILLAALAMAPAATPTEPPARPDASLPAGSAEPSGPASRAVTVPAAGPAPGAVTVPASGPAPEAAGPPAGDAPSPATAVLARLDGPLAAYAREVLERNPDLARARAGAAAAAVRAPQVAALPDPMAELMLYLLPPETRVGPVRSMARLEQTLPWFGKLRLRERQAVFEAAAAQARFAAVELRLLTEARHLLHELAYLDAEERVVHEDRQTLLYYEEIARARYASGAGLGQAVVKIQAEITRDDERLLAIAARRAQLLAAANALRDRPPGTAIEGLGHAPIGKLQLDLEELRRRAAERRPEVAEAEAAIAAAGAGVELARKEYRPDVTLGLTYALVDERDDLAGRLDPPEGNGADDLGISAAVNLPVWRRKLDAGVAEALARETEAGEAKRAVLAAIDREVGDLALRLPLIWQRLRLFEDVLTVQAAEALESAEGAYAAGAVGALELLDAERVLLEVRIATEHARLDYAMAVAELEGAIAAPLLPPPQVGLHGDGS